MIKFPEAVITSKVDGELVLLNSETGLYFGLNRVATRMVELLRELGNVDSAVEAFIKEYDAPSERIRDDMNLLIDSLRRKGLIELQPTG